MTYRIYFRSLHRVIGRDDFIAEDDEHAMAIAWALRRACADICTGIELWDGVRRVENTMRTTGKLSPGEIAEKIRNIVLSERWCCAMAGGPSPRARG